MKIGIGGPPNSGKSTFSWALYRYLNRDSYVTVGYAVLDARDQTLEWLLDTTGEVDRYNEDGDFSDIEGLLQRVKDVDESIVVCDLPGSIDPPNDKLVVGLDEIIILARSDASEEIKDWAEAAEEHSTEVFGTFITHLEDGPNPDWNPKKRRGNLNGLDRESVNEDYFEALSVETRTVIRYIAGEIKQKARTEYLNTE